MPPKKPSKPTGATGAAVLTSPSPCLQRGPEMPAYVFAPMGQPLTAFLQVCAAAAQVTVSLHQPSPTSVGGTPLFAGKLPPAPNPLEIALPPLSRGIYIVMWTYAAVGFWDICAELHVSGAARFRKVNSNPGDKIPVNAVWTYVEVV